MLAICGHHVSGINAANWALKWQMPMFISEFPEISGCYCGTINVKLDQPLFVIRPDHTTKPLRWHPKYDVEEVFDFLRIDFTIPSTNTRTPAWLYIAHKSKYYEDPFIHEIIAPKLNTNGLIGYEVCIRINREHQVLENFGHDINNLNLII